MGKLINVSIDVSKFDKSRFIKGKKGTYANVTISLNDEKDQFGNDCSLWQSQTEEERTAKEQRNFLGNGKIIWSSEGSPVSSGLTEDEENDLPF